MNDDNKTNNPERKNPEGWTWLRFRQGLIIGMVGVPTFIAISFVVGEPIIEFLAPAVHIPQDRVLVAIPLVLFIQVLGFAALFTWPFGKYGVVLGTIAGFLVAVGGLALLVLMICAFGL